MCTSTGDARETAPASRAEDAASANSVKSATDTCRPGEKCCKYSKVAAHIKNELIIRTVPSHPYPATLMIADPA